MSGKKKQSQTRAINYLNYIATNHASTKTTNNKQSKRLHLKVVVAQLAAATVAIRCQRFLVQSS